MTAYYLAGTTYSFPLDIVSNLPGGLGDIPISIEIDFGSKIKEGKGDIGRQTTDDKSGRKMLDPNSIQVINVTTGERVAFGRSDDFAYGDSGRVEWVVQDPSHTRFEIRFRATDSRLAGCIITARGRFAASQNTSRDIRTRSQCSHWYSTAGR